MIRYSNIQSFSRAKRKSKIPLSRKPIVQSYSGWTNSFNYLEPKLEKLTPTEPNYAREQSIGTSGLTWKGATPEQLNFIKRVYDINLARVSGRTFVNDVPDTELETVEGRFKLRKDAAQSARAMLQAARIAAEADSKNVSVGLNSAYRSASHQFKLWNDYVTNQYYAATKSHRKGLEGGEHGEVAAKYLARYTRGRIATPGYSNHNDGLAMDLRNTENGTVLQNRTNTAATTAWRNTWLWNWLQANAATYHFYQDTDIDEPWHWVYRTLGSSAQTLSLLGGVESIPNLVWPTNAGKRPNFLTKEFLSLINKGNGAIVINTAGAFWNKPIKDYIEHLKSYANQENGGLDVISETVMSVATLNAQSVVSKLKPLLKSATTHILDTIPKEIPYMAARTGLLLAWLDKAISTKTSENLEDYQYTYQNLLQNHQMHVDSINVIFGFLPYNIGFAIGKLFETLIDTNLTDNSLNIVQTGNKLKKFYKNLQRAIFDEMITKEVFAPDQLLLGTEFSHLKRSYADAVIGAWDREIQRLS